MPAGKFAVFSLLLLSLFIQIQAQADTGEKERFYDLQLQIGVAVNSLTLEERTSEHTDKYALDDIQFEFGVSAFFAKRTDIFFVADIGEELSDFQIGLSHSYKMKDVRAVIGLEGSIGEAMLITHSQQFWSVSQSFQLAEIGGFIGAPDPWGGVIFLKINFVSTLGYVDMDLHSTNKPDQNGQGYVGGMVIKVTRLF